jgi:hypothetical protein
MKDNDSFLRKQAWDYFAIHASQRISTFNFYIVLSSLLTTTYFSSFKVDSNLQSARPALAVLLICFSFIFWKLDKRNRYLIKNAEAALKIFEANEISADPQTRLFTAEAASVRPRTKLYKSIKTAHTRDFSYSDCFNLVFVGFASIGLVDIIRTAVQTVHDLLWSGKPSIVDIVIRVCQSIKL